MTDLQTIRTDVYIGRQNPAIVIAMYTDVDGVLTPIEWAGVASMVLTLTRQRDGVVQTIDTAVDAVINFATDGQLTFTLGELAESRPILSGVYDAELTSIDGSANELQLMHREHPTHRVTFEFHDTVTL